MKGWVVILLILGIIVLKPIVDEITDIRTTLMYELEIRDAHISQLRAEISIARSEIRYISEKLSEIQQEMAKWEILKLTATGYAPFDNISGICHNGDPWSTSTGTTPGPGTIAVDPREIPYGTRLYIQDYGWGEALDTGGAMRRGTGLIDLYFDTHQEAVRWGRREVFVLLERSSIQP